MISGVAAIVGRPNVGKSTVFNRLVGDRVSIVEDTPGVTRDRIYGKAEWLTKEFRLIDTGGIQIEDQPFQKEIQMQVEIAIEEADTVIFLVDGKSGLTDDDLFIARKLQAGKKPVILAVNKVDNYSKIANIYEFYKLGFGEPLAISGQHGIGIGDLLDRLMESFENVEHEDYDGKISFAVIGEPNVGKSSLINALLKEDRAIVSDIAGTTRDAVDTTFTHEGKDYVAIDTAGIRQRGRIYEKVEKYSILRAERAIDRSDVVLVVLDGNAGIRDQDKHVAGLAHEAGKGVILVYNKWDLVEKDDKTLDKKRKEIRALLPYLDYAPIAFVSAKTGQRVPSLFPLIDQVYEGGKKMVATSAINEVLEEATTITPPPTHKGRRLRIKYGTQVAVSPPTIVLFVNDLELLHFSYKRYLENQFRNAFGYDGNPIRIIARVKE
ncbi:MAG: ribosome biogenesis GTPase Der [Erysipelotrichales bacterium]|nr:ribosome biogenesis GTPase Der [Erysipelotrichales bacterium]